MWPGNTGTISTAMNGTTRDDTNVAPDGSDNHSLMHKQAGSILNGLPTVFGSTSGTNLLRNVAAASDQLLTANSGGTLSQTFTKGTANNMVFGTPSITGGTANSQTLGTPTVLGSVIGSANILNSNVPESKMRLDIAAGTTSLGTFVVTSWIPIPGGTVTIVLPVASNALINFMSYFNYPSGGPAQFGLVTDATADAIWGTGGNQSIKLAQAYGNAGFTAYRTGYASGTHNWVMWAYIPSGTFSANGFAMDFSVIPFAS